MVLGLQTLSFRDEWRQAYEVLLAEREVFTDAVRRQLDGSPAAVENLWPELSATPPSCFDYLGSLGLPLVNAPSLDPYLHSIEATESTQSGLGAAYRVVGDLRGLLRDITGALNDDERRRLQSDFGEQLQRLVSVLKRLPGNAPAARLQADVEAQLQRVDPRQLDGAAFDTWRRSADELLVRIQTRLREIRQTVSVGPSATP